MPVNEKSYENLLDLPPPPAASHAHPPRRHQPDEAAFDYSQYLPIQYIPPSLSSAATDFFRRLPALPTGLTPSALGPQSPTSPDPNLGPNMREPHLRHSHTSKPYASQYHKPRHPAPPSHPIRSRSTPLSPPPLTPIQLSGFRPSTIPAHRLLTSQLAEEIRLLIPPRYQIHASWTLLYASTQNGTALSTLYKRASDAEYAGYVLVIRDSRNGTFGAYLTDPPRIRSGYFGTGECFLWQASVLPDLRSGIAGSEAEMLRSLPPPPSADGTEMLGRSTTFRSPVRTEFDTEGKGAAVTNGVPAGGAKGIPGPRSMGGGSGAERTAASTGTSTPSERIRFRAFPYSGVNDFMIHCDPTYFSVGGGDGKYGLWLNEMLDMGISQRCPSFGNEPLSEEGEKFEVIGIEFWGL